MYAANETISYLVEVILHTQLIRQLLYIIMINQSASTPVSLFLRQPSFHPKVKFLIALFCYLTKTDLVQFALCNSKWVGYLPFLEVLFCIRDPQFSVNQEVSSGRIQKNKRPEGPLGYKTNQSFQKRSRLFAINGASLVL